MGLPKVRNPMKLDLPPVSGAETGGLAQHKPAGVSVT